MKLKTNMRLKYILGVSLASNAVLLSALGYITSLNTKPAETPAIIRYITNDAPASVVAAPAPLEPATGPGTIVAKP